MVLLEAATIYRKLKRYDEEAALIRRFARNYDNSFQGIFAALSSEIRRPRGLGRKNVWNALIRQRLPLVLKTTAIEQTDASIFSVGVRAICAVLSVVHFERHECAGGLLNQ